MIDVAEPGWEPTLRGQPAEIYAHWREDLQSHGFAISARIAGDDDQGAIGEAGLFLKWGACGAEAQSLGSRFRRTTPSRGRLPRSGDRDYSAPLSAVWRPRLQRALAAAISRSRLAALELDRFASYESLL